MKGQGKEPLFFIRIHTPVISPSRYLLEHLIAQLMLPFFDWHGRLELDREKYNILTTVGRPCVLVLTHQETLASLRLFSKERFCANLIFLPGVLVSALSLPSTSSFKDYNINYFFYILHYEV